MEHHTEHHGGEHVHKNDSRTLMGVLAYLGPLVIISYLVSAHDSFVKFHIKQGLVLLVIDIILWILGPYFWGLWGIIRIINFAILILSILGIINVVQGKEKDLPVVGQYAKHFTF
jgi:uncharacterized membrane protein